jgi:uncharacterized membrane protein YqjE
MKKFILKFIVALILVVVLDGSFFLFHDIEQCAASVWAALIGLNVGYLALFLIPLCAPKERGVKVLSDTLYLIGAFYFLLELIVGVIFLFWEQETPTIPVVAQAILLGLYIIVLIVNILANDSTQKALDKQNEESDNIKFLLDEAADVCLLVKKGSPAYRAVSQCYDDLKASPLRSTPEVTHIEGELSAALQMMHDYASSNDMASVISTASRVRQLVARRNSKLKNIRNY